MTLQNVFAVNGKYYNVKVTELQRNFQVLDNEDNAGRTVDGNMVRDVIGTFYNYTVRIEPVRVDMDEYDEMYDLVSAPADYVQLTILIGRYTQTFNAYVTKGSDKFRMVGDALVWSELSLNFVAMEPQRRPA